MSAQILQFPASTCARPSFLEQELHEIAIRLRSACRSFAIVPGLADEPAIRSGADELEAALFHALTLAGCCEQDRALRDLLNKRLSAKEGAADQ
jgi:hypothetical protein